MKRLFKPFAIIGAVLVVTCIGLIISATKLGAAFSLPISYNNNALHSIHSDNFPSDLTNVHEINIETSACSVIIKSGDGFSVEYSGVIGNLFCETTDDTLFIYATDHDFLSFGNISNLDEPPIIIVTVPQGHIFDYAAIQSSFGNIEVKNVTINSFYADSDVGNIRLQAINAEEIFLNCDVGNTEIIDCDVAYLEYDGDVGTFTLNTSGNVSEYYIQAESDVGTIYVNGARFSSFESNVNNGNEKRTLMVFSSVGDIVINIYE